MVVETGDRLHIITRRLFDGDLRRHFVGEVERCAQDLAMVKGFVFVFDNNSHSYVRLPETRHRVVGLGSAGHIINVLPPTIDIERLQYLVNGDNKLVLTDGDGYSLSINEFGMLR